MPELFLSAQDVPDEAVGNGTRARWWVFVVLAGLALALDLWVKSLVVASLTLGERRQILPFLDLHYGVNDGVAFGMLSGRPAVIFPAVALALLAVVAYVALDRRLLAAVAGGLLAGGSVGNVYERIIYGHVTDFLRLPYWPTFNVADVFIVTGVGLLLLNLALDARTPSSSEGR